MVRGYRISLKYIEIIAIFDNINNVFERKESKMFTHEQLWNAIDILARNNNFSTSGMARAAGLDPTTFNRSKRQSKYGQPRWPQFDTIIKTLTITNTSLAEFAKYLEQQN